MQLLSCLSLRIDWAHGPRPTVRQFRWDGRTVGGQTDARTDGPLYGWTDGLTVGQNARRTVGWTHSRTARYSIMEADCDTCV